MADDARTRNQRRPAPPVQRPAQSPGKKVPLPAGQVSSPAPNLVGKVPVAIPVARPAISRPAKSSASSRKPAQRGRLRGMAIVVTILFLLLVIAAGLAAYSGKFSGLWAGAASPGIGQDAKRDIHAEQPASPFLAARATTQRRLEQSLSNPVPVPARPKAEPAPQTVKVADKDSVSSPKAASVKAVPMEPAPAKKALPGEEPKEPAPAKKPAPAPEEPLPAKKPVPSEKPQTTVPADPAPSVAAGETGFFDREVLPILQAKCAICHQAGKASGGLEVRSRVALLKGGDSGAALVPGSLDKSLLWTRVAANEMPPAKSKNPLTDREKQLLQTWILHEKQGPMPVEAQAVSSSSKSGNHVDHATLFTSKNYAPLDAPPRLWRLSPHIYRQFAQAVLGGKSGARKVVGGMPNPFTANGKDGFSDVAEGGKVDEPAAVLLIENAQVLADELLKKKPRELAKVMSSSGPLGPSQLDTVVRHLVRQVLQRVPTAGELRLFQSLYAKVNRDAGPELALRTTTAAVFLLPDSVYRMELGQGTVDRQGRIRLAPREIAYSIAYALTDLPPDRELIAAAEGGRLATREGVAAQVKRLLESNAVDKPRILRFFQEYFGYREAFNVFKDDKENRNHDAAALVQDTDELVRFILDKDRDVFREMLTTNKAFVAVKVPEKKRQGKNTKAVYESYNLKDYPPQQPIDLPKEERAGILTQPSWLVAHSGNTENHAILRGKWVRERLLGGNVPDLPITVDAQLPEAPKKTLRQRMEVTKQAYCWNCHQRMNPLGLTFENFDHFGRFRKEELGKPVDASGLIDRTGDRGIEGPVDNSLTLIKKLANSDRARQVFIRHAFRYWMGRNETLGDARSLQEADAAYVKSNGSMKAMLLALLTSESFLYRAAPRGAVTSR